MNDVLAPLRSVSLKEVFIQRFEELILTGKLSIGEKLPSERNLAAQLGVSRPVVHEGLVELAAMGLVTLRPRVGTVVNDYRRQGALTLLNSLLRYQQGTFEPQLLRGMLDLRQLLETETARLAATNIGSDDLSLLHQLLEQEQHLDSHDVEAVVDIDFEFHHTIALASGNPLYAMLVKSCEPANKSLTRVFFSDPTVVPFVFDAHRQLVAAIADKKGDEAAAIMTTLLKHGKDVLNNMLRGRQ
ncbi:MAG: FadR family transcriptional regulator [Proteobacteria bacterium]|jgi:GntR family transcriptional regulator, transcriptional repressor for pyruvate dehydrogenase complex|nr:FadR family transcriptional regulator [Pseudomonadota bacterium]